MNKEFQYIQGGLYKKLYETTFYKRKANLYRCKDIFVFVM